MGVFSKCRHRQFFSLRAGEDSAGVQWVEVNFRAHWALIVAPTGTNRVGFAARETQTAASPTPAEAGLRLMVTGRRSNRPLPPSPGFAEMATNAVDSPENGGGSPAFENPGSRFELAAEPSSHESPAAEAPGLPRRATAAELFKTRYGYGA